MPLPTQLVRELKTRCHALKPVVRLGKQGITDAVVKELDLALAHHELLKIKVSGEDREERKLVVAQLCERTHSDCIQQTGSTAVLYRKSDQK